jgi:aquaporin Z
MGYRLSQKVFVEFVGAFLLVFTVGMATDPANRVGGVLAPIAIGSVLMVLIYAGGSVSGGHYNPAVSTAVFLRGRLAANEYGAYVLAQLAAAVLAGLVVIAVGGRHTAGATGAIGKMLIVESLFTFALAYVVLSVATAEATEGNSYFGLAIGFVVVVGGISVGWVSGAAFNPAVALGATVLGAFTWPHIWVYFFADLVGGVVAAAAFVFIQADSASGERVTGWWAGHVGNARDKALVNDSKTSIHGYPSGDAQLTA